MHNRRGHAVDLAAFAPDVVLAAGAPTVIALKEVSSTMPWSKFAERS